MTFDAENIGVTLISRIYYTDIVARVRGLVLVRLNGH